MTTKPLHHENGIRSARLFRNGRSQAVRIPKEYEFESSHVTIRRDGPDRLVIERDPPEKTGRSLVEYLQSLQPIDDAWEDPTDDDLLPLDEIDL